MTQAKSILSKPQKLVIEVQDATSEGARTLAKNFSEASFGGLFIKTSEFGLYFKNANKQQMQFMGNFCNFYDGIVPAKIIKTEDYQEEIKNLPINVLAYSDYTIFQGVDMCNYFNTILSTGFCRRFSISFQAPAPLIDVSFTDSEERQLYNEISDLGHQFFNLFEQVGLNDCYTLEPTAKLILNNYKSALTNLYNSEPNSLVKKEIKSRELKALKLSGLFACINHPTEIVINDTDIKQAISVVEYLSTDFKKFVRYKEPQADKYDVIYDWFKDRVGEKFTKTEICKNYHTFGYSRAGFAKEFNDIIRNIVEIAPIDGYVFNIVQLPKNGYNYSLIKTESQELSSNVLELNEILNTNPAEIA